MKKYDKYKPTGIDWLGCVPEHWKIVRIKDFCNITRGRVISQLDLEDEGYPVYSSQTADNGCLGYISTYDFEGEAITWTTDGAKAGTVFLRNGKYNCTNVCGILQLKSSVKDTNIKFVAHSLGFIALHNKRLDINGYKIMSNEMAFIVIALPPLDEQTVIATYLDERTANIDRRIELLRNKIEHYKQLRRSLISQVVTRGLNPNVKLKPSGIDWLGDIPEHWMVKRLKDLCKIFGRIGFRGYTSEDLVSVGEGAITIGGKNITNNVLNLSNADYISWEKYYESPEIMVHQGDLLMAQRGTLGRVALVKDKIGEATINPSLVLINSISVNSDRRYLYYYLVSEFVKTQIGRLNTATAVPMISQNQIENMFVSLPNLDEQTAIAAYLDEKTSQIDNIVSKCEKQIEQLTELRRSLISQVVTGQIKVC